MPMLNDKKPDLISLSASSKLLQQKQVKD